MKRIFNYILVSLVTAASFVSVSCIDETEPTSSVTADQLGASLKATEALLWGVPAKMVEFGAAISTDYHYDWGVGTVMHMRDCMGDEYVVTPSSYDWYDSWENNQYLGENYLNQQLVWQTYYKEILATNALIDAIDSNSEDTSILGALGAGYAFRANAYLDLARMYEYLPTDGTSAVNSNDNNVTGLTVPIVTEQTTEEDSRNNPRAGHNRMLNFIIEDLDKAEQLIPGLTVTDNAIPHLNVIYGLKARAYLWHASYLEEGLTAYNDTTSSLSAAQAYKLAEEYAEKAIALGQNRPLTEDEWLSTTSGFNTPVSSWMLYMGTVKENDAVQSGIINWTSWCSNETSYGYASAGPLVCASPVLYESMSDFDFRKLSFKAPEGTRLAGKEPRLVDDATFEAYPDYASLKFRPGSGNMSDYNVGSATCVPLMRIEEMYFIAAEAKIHTAGPKAGLDYLAQFMQNYRYKAYNTRSVSESDAESVLAEIMKQKRIEFWGEGINYYDIKRLNTPVTRIYEGTNFRSQAQFNTTTRPAWMNWVIVRNEGTNNKAVKEWNNPDPSDCYTSSAAKERNYANPFESYASSRGLKKALTNFNF